MAFNINAQVILSAPKNIQKVRQTISKGLSGISANIDLKVDTKSAGALKSINVELEAMKKNLKVINAQKISLGNFRQFSSQATKTATSLSSIGSAAQKTNQSLSKTSKQVKEATNDITNFGKESALATRRFAAFTVVSGGIFGLIRSFKSGVSQAINFEKQILRVQQVTGDAGVGISGLKREIDILSVSLGVASDELVQVSLTLAQTGKTIPQIRSALTAIAKATLAPTFGDIKDTTEGVIAALEQFNISASKTEEVLGSLNAVSKSFAVEAADLISVIRRAGGVFAAAEPQFKGPQESLNELIAIFTAVRSTTRESAETIATGLRTIFSRIQRPATVQFLKQFGVELVDAQGQFVGTFEAFKRIAAGIEGLQIRGDAIGLARIVEELGGIRQAGKIIPLLQNFAKAEDARRVALEGTASISEDLEIAQKGLGFSVDQLKQKFTKFIRDVVESQSFQSLARTILAIGDNLLSVVDALRPLLPLFTTIATIKISESLINFGKGFIGGFKQLGGLEGLGERIGGLGSVDTVGDSAQTQKVNNVALENNTKSLLDNSAWLSKNTDSLLTLNKTMESVVSVSNNLITAAKSLESKMIALSASQMSQTPGGIFLPPSVGGGSPLKPPKRRSMGGPADGQTLLKSGEAVISPENVKAMKLSNLRKMNQGISMVGGNSPIDSIPADLDDGSFVLNRRGAQGLMSGGMAKRTKADDLFDELDRSLADVLQIPNEWLPEDLRDRRVKKVAVSKILRKLDARDAAAAKRSGRGVSVKFDKDRNITESSPERLAAIESYRSQVEKRGDISEDDDFSLDYITPNDDKLYRSQMAFVKQLIRERILTEEDFEPEEFSMGGLAAKPASGYTPYKMGDIRRRRRRSTSEDGTLTDQAKYYAMLRQKRFGRRFAGTDFEMEEFLEELKEKQQGLNDGGQVKFAGLFLLNKMGQGKEGLAAKIAQGGNFFNFDGQTSEIDSTEIDLKDYLGKTNKKLTPQEISQFVKDLTSNKNPYFKVRDIDNDIKQLQGKISTLKDKTDPTAISSIARNENIIEFLKNKKDLALEAMEDQKGYFPNIVENRGNLKFDLGIGYPPPQVGEEVFKTAIEGFLHSSKQAAQDLSSGLGVSIGPPVSDADLLKNVGIFDVAGKVFESAVNQLGPPLTSDDGGAQKGFDFPEGLSQLSSKFHLQGFEKAPTDAKISLTSDSKSSIKNKKIPNLIKERLDAITKPWKTKVGFDLPKGFQEKSESRGYTDALFRSVNVSFDPPRTLEEIQEESRNQSAVGVNKGGDITSGSEIANTILTPGELVFPPDEVQRAGLSNLMSFNKTGDPSFLNDFNPNNISMVPGSGNTDTHKQILPAGSFVVKKKSSESMGDGFQKLRSGGLVGDPQPLKAGGMAQPSMAKSLLPALPGIALAATQLGGIDFSNMQQVTTVLFPMLSVMIGSVTDKLGDYKKSKEEYIKNQEQLANSIPHLTDEIIESAKKLRSATGKPAVTAEQEQATRKYIDERLQKLPEADRAKKLSGLKDKLTGQRSDAMKQMGPLGRLQLGTKEGFAKGIFGQGLKEIPAGLTKLSKGLGIAAAASFAAGPAIDQLTSFVFKDNKRETLASGQTGLTGKDASNRAVAAASLKGAISGGAIGFTVGNAIFPGAGGAIGAAAGAFLGAVNSAVNAKFEQLKFENLLRVSEASKAASEALEKFKDVTDAKQLEEYNKAIGELFDAQTEATKSIAEEQIRIANRSWGDFFYEGTIAFVQSMSSLGSSIAESTSEFFRGITGASITQDKEQEVRTEAFSQTLQNIDPSTLRGVVDNFAKIAENSLGKLSLDQLKELENLDQSNIEGYIRALEESGNVSKAETEALKKIIATRATISAQTVQQAVGPDNKKASAALLAPLEIFSRELSENRSLEEASKSAISQFRGSLKQDFQGIFKDAKSLEDIGTIFETLTADSKKQLATDLGFESVTKLTQSIGALSDAGGKADVELINQIRSTELLKRQTEKVTRTIDAIGSAFAQLSARFNNIVSDLNVAAGNLQIDLDNIFSTTGGSLARKQNVNVFENIAGRSITEFEDAVDRLSKAAGLAAEDMSDIPATLVVTEKIPEILKKTVDAVRASGVTGVTEISGTQLQAEFVKQIEKISGIKLDQLSEPIRDSILETFEVALGGGRAAESGEGGKSFSLKQLEDAVKSGAIQNLSADLLEKIRQEADSLEKAISTFQDTMYQAADFQRRILEEQMNASMEILNRQQSINNRFRKVLDLDFDPLQTAISDQAARISQLTGGQVATADPMKAAEQLFARQQALQGEKDRIERAQADMGIADSSGAAELSKELGSVQQALQDNSKAIEELKSSNEILEAATETLTKANEARMSARERATMVASKLGDAKNPMEMQEIMSDFLAPTIAASKMASGMALSFKDFASIMGDPSQVQASFGLSSMDMESTIANLMRGFTMTGGAQLFGPMLSERLFGAGATRMGESDEERAAMSVVQASTEAANKLTEALSSENSIKAIEKLEDFNKLVLAAGDAAVEAGKKFQEFRATMLPSGDGSPTAGPIGLNRGGLVGYNRGGLVPNSILTPGESVFAPSVTKAIGSGNLQKLNKGGVSTVPGVGSTDSVPAFLEPGSFVLNKGASRGLKRLNNGTDSASEPLDELSNTGTLISSAEENIIIANEEITAANIQSKLPTIEGISVFELAGGQEDDTKINAVEIWKFLQDRKNQLKQAKLNPNFIDIKERLKQKSGRAGTGVSPLESPDGSTPPIEPNTFESNILKNYPDVKSTDISHNTKFKDVNIKDHPISDEDKKILTEAKIKEHDLAYVKGLATSGLKYKGSDTGIKRFMQIGYNSAEKFVKGVEWNPYYSPELEGFDSSIIQKDFSEESDALIKKIASTALDFLPIVGTIKAGQELWTGVDALTGEEVPWWAAGIGLIAGIVPDGGLLVSAAKGASKQMKKGGKLGKLATKTPDNIALETDQIVDSLVRNQNLPNTADDLARSQVLTEAFKASDAAASSAAREAATSAVGRASRGASATDDIARVSRQMNREGLESSITSAKDQLTQLIKRKRKLESQRFPRRGRGNSRRKAANTAAKKATEEAIAKQKEVINNLSKELKELDDIPMGLMPPRGPRNAAAAAAASTSGGAKATTQAATDVVTDLTGDIAGAASRSTENVTAAAAASTSGRAKGITQATTDVVTDLTGDIAGTASRSTTAAAAGVGSASIGRGLEAVTDFGRRALGALDPRKMLSNLLNVGKGLKNKAGDIIGRIGKRLGRILSSPLFSGILRSILKNLPDEAEPERIAEVMQQEEPKITEAEEAIEAASTGNVSRDSQQMPSLDDIDYLKTNASKKMFVHFSKFGKAGMDLASESIYDMIYAKDSRKDAKFENVRGVAAKSAMADAKVAAEKMEIERILGLDDNQLRQNPELFIHRRDGTEKAYQELTSGDVGVRGLKDYMHYQKMLLRLKDKTVSYEDGKPEINNSSPSEDGNILTTENRRQILAERGLAKAQEIQDWENLNQQGQEGTPRPEIEPTTVGSLMLDHTNISGNDPFSPQIHESAQLLSVQKTKQNAENDLNKLMKSKSNQKRLSRMGMVEAGNMESNQAIDDFNQDFVQQSIDQLGVTSSQQQQYFWAGGNWGALRGQGMAAQTGLYGKTNVYSSSKEYEAPTLNQSPIEDLGGLHKDIGKYKAKLIEKNETKLKAWFGPDLSMLLNDKNPIMDSLESFQSQYGRFLPFSPNNKIKIFNEEAKKKHDTFKNKTMQFLSQPEEPSPEDNLQQKLNRGGSVTAPNSILTPGEAVFTPAMTKSLGYQNLSYFNKTGDSSALSGFNRGGISKVPGVGNTDSVPAHLPTGSFVVKKSSAANLPGFNRGTASSGTSSMQRMIGDFISFTKSFFNKLSGTLPTMKASEAANSTTLASEQKAGNVQQINNDIILLPQKLDESFRVFDNVTNRFITQFNPLINQLDNAVTRLEALPALQVQLDAKVGPVEVILNGVELLGAFEEKITNKILSAVSQQIGNLVPNADGSPKGPP